jgi:hypothetical protein
VGKVASRDERSGAGATALRLAVSIRVWVTSDAVERVPTGGELTLFEAVGLWA